MTIVITRLYFYIINEENIYNIRITCFILFVWVFFLCEVVYKQFIKEIKLIGLKRICVSRKLLTYALVQTSDIGLFKLKGSWFTLI